MCCWPDDRDWRRPTVDLQGRANAEPWEGLTAGEPATVRTERGAITLPVVIADLPDGVVWLPANSPGSQVRGTLGAGHGDLVGVSA